MEHIFVVLGGQAVQLQDPLAQLAALARPGRLLDELDAGPLGQHLQRPAKVDLLDQLHKGEDVAAPVAAEAVPGLRLRRDPEARRLLGVKRTEARELAAHLT